MNPEEAIKMFKAIIMAEIDRLPYHYDAEIGEDVYDDISKVDELLQLNKIVSKALEKQIAKKSKIYNYKYFDMFDCPNCKQTFDAWEGYSYCPECGQKLNLET